MILQYKVGSSQSNGNCAPDSVSIACQLRGILGVGTCDDVRRVAAATLGATRPTRASMISTPGVWCDHTDFEGVARQHNFCLLVLCPSTGREHNPRTPYWCEVVGVPNNNNTRTIAIEYGSGHYQPIERSTRPDETYEQMMGRFRQLPSFEELQYQQAIREGAADAEFAAEIAEATHRSLQ